MAPPFTAYHRTPVAPSGVSHAVSCRLFHSPRAPTRPTARPHVVTARDNSLSVWQLADDGRTLSHVRTHRLHGVVTSISVVRTLASHHDGLDRILCAFQHAKLALVEWSDQAFDLVNVSLHSFEKLPQVVATADGDANARCLVAHDPQSRMTVLHLATNAGGDGTLAVLPWFTEDLDLEGLGLDRDGWHDHGASDIPYAPSHLIPLTSLQPPVVPAGAGASSSSGGGGGGPSVNAFLPNQAPPIRNVVALTFLPGFTEPTLALLYAPDLTWSGRLEHLAHNHLVALVTLSTRAPDAAAAAAGGAGDPAPTVATLISTSPPLAYSLVGIEPVPRRLGIGHVLLTSVNGVVLLDIQGGTMVAAATNAWFRRDFPPGRPVPPGLADGSTTRYVDETLEGAVITFLNDDDDDDGDDDQAGEENNVAVVFCRSGRVLTLEVERTGRSISGLKLDALDDDDDAATRCEGGVSCAVRLGGGRLFVGGEQADSRLVQVERIIAAAPATDETTKIDQDDDEDDMMDEDDEAIYGDSTNRKRRKIDAAATTASASSRVALATNGSSPSSTSRRFRLETLDKLEAYGSVRSLVMGLAGDGDGDGDDPASAAAELVGATGAGRDAGLTVFHRTLPTTGKRPDPLEDDAGRALVATDGIWTVSTGPRVDRVGDDTVSIASNERGTFFYEPVPGDGGGTGTGRGSLNLVRFERGFRTVFAASIGTGDGTVVVLVGSDELRVFDRDLEPVGAPVALSLRIPVGASARASVTGSYLAIHTGSRSSIESRLYHLDEATKSLCEVEQARGHGRIAVWRDVDRVGQLVRPAPATARRRDDAGARTQMDRDQGEDDDDDEDEDLYGATTHKGVPRPVGIAMDRERDALIDAQGVERAHSDERYVANEAVGNEGRDWVVRIDEHGTLTIHLLPTMLEVFRSDAVSLLPLVISDAPDSSSPAPVPASIDPDDLAIDRVHLVNLGASGFDTLHLVVWTANGTLAVYETFSADVGPLASSSDDASSSLASPRLGLRFVKTLVRHVPISTPRRKGAASSEAPPVRKEIVPFVGVSDQRLSGAFVTGEDALWLVKGRRGPARGFDASDKGVYGFALAAAGAGAGAGGDFAVMTFGGAGRHVATVPRTTSVEHELPLTRIKKDRTYAYLAFDLESGMYVGGTLNATTFVAFDDEGNPVFKDTAPGLLEPTNYQSTLELLVPGTWEAIDGYEFRQNEFVCTVKTVSLHSKSRAGGMRDFIAVGTTVYRGEDLSAKGGIYIFEVTKVVADPAHPRRDHVLTLRFFEDTKSIVGNMCDLNGYLFLSMGQKLYARAFEQDEVLIAVGFLDLGVHVTSLTALKNFLLIGDAMQSVALVAFQEDPYKLVFLGRDYRPSRISNANFLVNEGRVSFVTGDDKGVLRMFEYDPSNIASHAGQRLLCRTEYHAGSESIATMLIAKHAVGEDPKQNGILFGGIDGSIYTLVPVRDAVFRRLQTLQTTMTRHVLHFAGLNPRGYRIVKNDTVSRAITKGILDGDLLSRFEYLALDVQTDLAVHCGTDVDTVLANLRNLRVYE